LRAAVLPCAGKGGAGAARRIATSLAADDSLKVLDRDAVKRALAGGHLASTADYARLAHKLGLDALVTCRVVAGAGARAQVVLRDGSGAVVDRLKWSGKSGAALAARISALSDESDDASGDDAWDDAEPAAKLEPQARPGAAPIERKRASRRSTSGDSPHVAEVTAEEEPFAPANGVRYFEVAVTPGVLSRNFVYFEQLPAGSRTLRHALPAVPVLQADAEVFPFANLGVHLSGQTLVGAKTRLADDSVYPSTGYGFEGGVLGRLRFDPAELRARFTVGQQVQETGVTGHPEQASPKVAYTFLEPTIGARVTLFSRLRLEADAGFRFLLDAGELSSRVYLQKTTAGGLELAAMAAFRIIGTLDVRLQVSYRRYFFKAIPDNGLIDGAAVDQYVQGGLGMAYQLDF
jgi:hypothetical protein